MDLDVAQLRSLRAAVDEGTFEAAARTLHVTPSAISQRIKALEVAVGRVLVERSTPVRVTESGAVLLRLARRVELLTAETLDELAAGDAPGRPLTLAIAVNADSLATWVLPALSSLASELSLDLRRDDQEHSTSLLRDGTVMAAITADAVPVQGCTVTRLGSMRYRALASPAFVARWFPAGVGLAALSAAPVVVFDRKDELQTRYLRERTAGGADPPRHYVPASGEFARAIRLGFGWGMLPDLQGEHDERDGHLVDIDPGAAVDVALFWQQWKLPSAALERVGAAVKRAAAASLR